MTIKFKKISGPGEASVYESDTGRFRVRNHIGAVYSARRWELRVGKPILLASRDDRYRYHATLTAARAVVGEIVTAERAHAERAQKYELIERDAYPSLYDSLAAFVDQHGLGWRSELHHWWGINHTQLAPRLRTMRNTNGEHELIRNPWAFELWKTPR